MAGINIDVAVNSRAAVGGVKDLSAALDDTGDALDDLVRTSDKAGDKSADALKGTERAADNSADAVEDLERKFRDLTTATKRQDDAADKAARSSRESFHEAGAATGEFRDEALSNFSEVTSSFDGSMQSVVDLAQGTFGGLASLGGPVGLALGGLAALIGVTFSALSTSADQNAQEAAQSISDMFQDMTESGQQFVSQDFVNQKIQEIIGNQEKLNAVKEDAARAAVSQQTALRAEAGDQDALKVALQGAEDAYARIRDRIDEVVKNGGTVSGELRDQSGAAADLVQHYKDLAANQDTAKAKADLYAQATSATAAAMADADAKAKGLANSITGIPRTVGVKVNVDDAAAQERLRQLGKSINVDMYVTPRTGRGIS